MILSMILLSILSMILSGDGEILGTNLSERWGVGFKATRTLHIRRQQWIRF
jgi:hypothetical protein